MNARVGGDSSRYRLSEETLKTKRGGRRKRYLSPEEHVELIEGRRAGESLADLARRFGIHNSTVSAYCKRAGLVGLRRTYRVPYATGVAEEEAFGLWLAGEIIKGRFQNPMNFGRRSEKIWAAKTWLNRQSAEWWMARSGQSFELILAEALGGGR